MSTTSANRIRHSYRLLAPKMSRMTQIFYKRLFAHHPEVRALFKVDMTQQGAHLAAALALIVTNLPLLDALELPLRELGALHARLGVRSEHYPIVKDLMLFALAEVAGNDW